MIQPTISGCYELKHRLQFITLLHGGDFNYPSDNGDMFITDGYRSACK